MFVTNRIAIVLIAIFIVIMTVAGITACTATPYQDNPEDITPSYSSSMATGSGSLTDPGTGIHAQQTASPNIIAVDINYSDFIPEIKFGELICSFVQNNEKTFLYSDVSYEDAVRYSSDIKDMGYDLKSEDGSKATDSYQSELYNAKFDVSVYVKYSQSGLSVKVFLENDD